MSRLKALFGNIGRPDHTAVSAGSWQEVVSTMVGGRDSRRVLAYIERGEIPGGPLTGPAGSGPAAITRRVMETGPRDLHRHPRVVLRAAALMTPAERDRFSNLLWLGPWDLRGVAQLNGRATTAQADPADLLSIDDLERFGEAAGWAPDAVLDALLTTRGPNAYLGHSVGTLEGVSELLVREADVVRSALTPAAHEHVAIWRRLSRMSDETAAAFAAQVCDAATANSKALRQVAAPFVSKLPAERSVAELKRLAVEAKPAQRAQAVRLGARVARELPSEDFAGWAAEALAGDRAKAVQEAIAELAHVQEPEELRPELPPVEIGRVERLAVTVKPGRRPIEAEMLAVLNGAAGAQPGQLVSAAGSMLRQHPRLVANLTAPQVARVLLAASPMLRWSGDRIGPALHGADCPDPLMITAVAMADGGRESDVVAAMSNVYRAAPDLWTADQITPWVAYHAETLAGLLDTRTDAYRFDRTGMFALIEAATAVPASLERALVEAAVAGYRSDRDDLYRIVGVEAAESVFAFLSSRKRAERLGAAQWIRAHPTTVAASPLREAARKEQDDGAKAAMLGALEALDESIDEFVSAEALARDAATALAKKSAVPKSLGWLNVDSLPPLAWADGTPVAPEIVRWFLATAVKAKTAEPSPIVRRHFDNMEPEALRTFGSTLLDFWLAEDLRTRTEAEAMAIAQQQAPHRHRWGQQGQGPFANMTLQEVTDALYLEARQQVAGSAASSKGVLGVVAAAAGPEVAERTLAYIRKHRGHRVSQAKALLQMLAWIDEPVTVQAVMAIATRFRPKGIQNEATVQAQLLADRHGWTLDDLADRSVPTGGFESNGRQIFDYGTRTFTAHLGDDLSVTLINDETSKPIRSLPKGRADEDPELVADAKKDFTAAKKELKSASVLQPERLHLAMCTQRSWTVDEYTRYFLDHPVVIRLATRLVWLASDPHGTRVFRPLTDGTLVDVDDEEVTLDADVAVTLAHEQLIDREDASQWQQHLADYEVDPLFAQLGRPSVEITADQTVIDDFVGHMHNDGSLRGLMNRYGWQLGLPQDAGIVFELVKDVPSASLKAVIELHGGMPAGAWDVGSWKLALGQLFFVDTAATYFQAADAVKLTQVPPILLTETFAEAQAMALAGEGYDADYDKKVGP